MPREGIDSYDEIKQCQLLDKYNLTDRKVSAITIKGGHIRFNISALHLLNDVQYVEMLVNPQEKYLLIIPCQKSDVFAIDWCKIDSKTGKIESKDIPAKFLSPKLYRLMDWDWNYQYKVQCFFQDFGQDKVLLFFDLMEYVTLVPTSVTLSNGKTIIRNKPYYLANWEDSFGPPLPQIMEKVSRNFMDYYVDGETEDIHELRQSDAKQNGEKP